MDTTVTERPMPTGEGLTFEKVWAMFQETDKKFQEANKRLEKTERMIDKNGKQLDKTERMIIRNGRQIGGLHRSFGEIAEHLVAPGIEKRFNQLGYHFDEMAPKGHKIIDKETGKVLTEIDILLENGDTIIVVEVKAKPAIQDIEHHIKRIEILRNRRHSINDKRKILGAIAGAIYEDEVKEAVREAGFFVIEQSGDTMKIDMPEGFVPREF
jgi:hypothetical protein